MVWVILRRMTVGWSGRVVHTMTTVDDHRLKCLWSVWPSTKMYKSLCACIWFTCTLACVGYVYVWRMRNENERWWGKCQTMRTPIIIIIIINCVVKRNFLYSLVCMNIGIARDCWVYWVDTVFDSCIIHMYFFFSFISSVSVFHFFFFVSAFSVPESTTHSTYIVYKNVLNERLLSMVSCV